MSTCHIIHHPRSRSHERVTELCLPGHPAPAWEASLGHISAVQPFLKPNQYFIFHPSNPIGPKSNPFREFSGLFQACDVLRRVQNQLLQLALRQDPHRDLSMFEEHRDAQVSKTPRLRQLKEDWSSGPCSAQLYTKGSICGVRLFNLFVRVSRLYLRFHVVNCAWLPVRRTLGHVEQHSCGR